MNAKPSRGLGHSMDSIPELGLVYHWHHIGNQLSLTILATYDISLAAESILKAPRKHGYLFRDTNPDCSIL